MDSPDVSKECPQNVSRKSSERDVHREIKRRAIRNRDTMKRAKWKIGKKVQSDVESKEINGKKSSK